MKLYIFSDSDIKTCLESKRIISIIKKLINGHTYYTMESNGVVNTKGEMSNFFLE